MRQVEAPKAKRCLSGDMVAALLARAKSQWHSQRRVLSVALVSAVFPIQASAHGEGAILMFVAALASGSGLLGGVLSGTWKQAEHVNWPQWFLVYLIVGCIVAGVMSGDFGGAALFLAFGGIGGVLPFLVAFYAARPVASWIKRWVGSLVARGDA